MENKECTPKIENETTNCQRMAIVEPQYCSCILLFVVLQVACRLYRTNECRNWISFTQWMNLHVNYKSIVIVIAWHTSERRVGLEVCIPGLQMKLQIRFSLLFFVSLSHSLSLLSFVNSVQWIFHSQCHRWVAFIRISQQMHSETEHCCVSCSSCCLFPIQTVANAITVCLCLPGPMRYIPFANGFHHQLNSFFASPDRNARVVWVSLSLFHRVSCTFDRAGELGSTYVTLNLFGLYTRGTAIECMRRGFALSQSVARMRWQSSSFSERKKNIVFHLNAHALTERWIDVDCNCERDGWRNFNYSFRRSRSKTRLFASRVLFHRVSSIDLFFHLPISHSQLTI